MKGGARAPQDDYRTALEGVAWTVRAGRRWLRAGGKAPRRMLLGMVSGRLPPPAVQEAPGRWRGRAEPSALLDVKGKMLADLRALPVAGDEEALLLDVPEAGFEGALAHFRKFLPPRFASLEDVSPATVLLTVMGPRAASLLGGILGVGADELDSLEEGGLLVPGEAAGDVTVVRSGEVATPAWDVVAGSQGARALESALTEAGARPVDERTWRTLRIEAGRPEYGVDMDAGTIPVEAGIQARVVDYAKGCFTGQEVLIRIRDRGHVNRHLRGLRLGPLAEPPEPGTGLFQEDGKAVGWVTSSAASPRFGETIGLGYVRREVRPPGELRLGAADGPRVGVHDLDGDWGPPRE